MARAASGARFGVIAPLAILAARFGKFWPGQRRPDEPDSQHWWRMHWIPNLGVTLLSLVAVYLVLRLRNETQTYHCSSGYVTLALVAIQIFNGLARGSKGGPTEPEMRGDH